MSKLVSRVKKETISKNGPTIKLLEDVLTECEFFFMSISESEYHEKIWLEEV
jgi:hypothetical protein